MFFLVFVQPGFCFNMLTLVLSQHVVEWQTGSTQSFQRPQETQFCTKLDPLFSLSSTCQQKKSNIARKLPFLSLMCFFFVTQDMEEKLSFPVFPRINDESTSKSVQTNCSPQETRLLVFFSTRCQLSINSLVLCYICVHFTVLWCSCQIFPLNESFNPLLDDYRTGEEPCSQLLCDLQK